MPDAKENPSFEAVTAGLLEEARKVVSQLHAVALHHGCRFRVDRGDAEGRYTLTYSGRSYAVHVDGNAIALSTEYDIRAFLHFYRNTANPTARELLFHAAAPCEYCINDKCTTLVSGANRTITWWNEAEGICQEKKLCGPYRHFLRIGPVTPDNLESVRAIAEMAFRYCTPEMHADVLRENKVGCRTGEIPGVTVIGYPHAVSCFGVQVEPFMQECLVEDGGGRTKMDVLFGLVGQDRGEEYIGVTTQYVNSACYQFIFGIACEPEAIPAALPEGVATYRIQPGEYAVYTSSAGDYRSVWQHFSESYYPAEHKGYDRRRVFFEHYDKAGRLVDVCIPVSAEMPQTSGRYTRAIFTPDIKVAGVLSCNEKDHPLYKETAGVRERLLRDFPHAERIVLGSIHSRPGWPMVDFIGVEVDQLDAVPEGLDVITLRGGWWNMVAYPYPRRGEYEIGAPAYRPRFEINGLSHPRAFLELNYTGRGAYSEVYTPIRLQGGFGVKPHRVELVDLPVCHVIGKEEAPPESFVTEAEIRAFPDMEANLRKGSCVMAFRYELHRKMWYFQKPVIKGVEAAPEVPAPGGMRAYTLEGGKYAKITEVLPNGEFDWSAEWYAFKMMKEHDGYELDLSRLFIVRQLDYGRAFELYAPVR